MLLNYASHCRNLTFQRFATVAEKKDHNETNEKHDTRMYLNTDPRLVSPMLYPLSHGCQ